MRLAVEDTVLWVLEKLVDVVAIEAGEKIHQDTRSVEEDLRETINVLVPKNLPGIAVVLDTFPQFFIADAKQSCCLFHMIPQQVVALLKLQRGSEAIPVLGDTALCMGE